MRKCSKTVHHSLTELNITPLLDLAFVLLVIFIITTTPIVNDLELNLPSASKHPKDAPPKAGGVVFAATREGNLVALDARTGTHLWHVQTGGNMAASPMSYAVAGRQYVAISAGTVLFSFALPE